MGWLLDLGFSYDYVHGDSAPHPLPLSPSFLRGEGSQIAGSLLDFELLISA